MLTIDELCERAHKIAKEKGFWDGVRNKGEMVALMHSELSEMLEAIRDGGEQPLPSTKIPGYTAEEEELADLFIRAGDYAKAHKLRIVQAIVAKMAYNAKRPQKHGKKF